MLTVRAKVLPLYLDQIRNKQFKSIIKNHSFSKVDIKQFEYEEIWDNHFKFRNFLLASWVFDCLEIALINGNIWITFFSSAPSFINKLPHLLGRDSMLSENDDTIARTKVGKVLIADKTARVSYIIYDSHLAAIKVNFINN